MYLDGHKAASAVRDEFVSVTEKLMDELAQCSNVLPQRGITNTIDFCFSSRRRHTRCLSDWSSDVCSSDLGRRIPMVVGARDYGNVCPIRTLVRHGEVCAGPAPLKCLECARTEYGVPKTLLAVPGVLGGRWEERRVGKGGGLWGVGAWWDSA